MTMKPAVLAVEVEDEELVVVERVEEKEDRRPLVSEVRVVARRVG